MVRSIQQFTTIRTEGALLPPDILQRIASQKVDGVRPSDYHLPEEGFKITEAVTQSWDILKKHWKSFQDAREQLSDSETGTATTNERWLLPLFQQLGYGRLTTQPAPVVEERTYPIERFYNNTPIHLIGCNLTLDRRTKGARGAATASPHSMVQEYLNRSADHLWAFLSNGRQLRLLRDNVALSRQAYVEFDLEAMMDGEVYSDFALLWMLCHQSRIEAPRNEDCWLEKWSKLAREEGTRVLKDLRTGVTNAIEALGRGFIGHPQNDELRRKLQEIGSLSKEEFYRQLLRIVYRLLFLFVAEDRELLHPADADENAKELYRKYYSTGRLRDMSLKLRGSKHADLWHVLSLIFSSLGKNEGCSRLGLVGLGSFLWNTKSVADLAGPHEVPPDGSPVQIANDELLTAIRALAYVEHDKVLRSVDYRNLGSEELGSVYESLLELHPEMHVEARQFDLRTAAGNQRKTTGSYYTPDSLVQCLLDSALDPVLADRLKGKKSKEAEAALLSIKVCDPACGSGHFLIAAAHRLARQLARIRTGESEPSPEDHQHALRDVIGHCIYGVDLNPMAVELCKVSLWIEAIEPGRPLSFLEHHIQVGNSLFGTTPSLLKRGVPDEAFTQIEGDVKARVTELKKRNKKEREDHANRQGLLFDPPIKLGNLGAELAQIDEASDDTPEAVNEKERRYAEFVHGGGYQYGWLLADTWCATFVWKKDDSDLGKLCPTERDFRNVESRATDGLLPHVLTEVERLSDQYQFFHWHLAFPDVFRLPGKDETPENQQTGWSGGFDVVLGNPPWDTLSPDRREYFAKWVDGIRSMPLEEQQAHIDRLLAEGDIAAAWAQHCRELFALVHFLKNSGAYTLFASGNLGKGDFNIYRMFVELALRHIRLGGFASQVAPAGLYGGANATAIRKFMFDENRLTFLAGFENKGSVFFPGVHPQTWFTVYAVQRGGSTNVIRAIFGVDSVESAGMAFANAIELDAEFIRQLAPDTYAIPDLQNLAEVTVLKKMYERYRPFGDESMGPPMRHYQREIEMDCGFFTADLSGLPVYEGRMIDHFDHRAKTYVSGHGNSAVWIARTFGDPEKAIRPQWRVLRENVPRKLGDRVDRYRIGFGDVANPRNERSFIATLIPPAVICGNTVPTIDFGWIDEWAYLPWLAIANSFVMDALVRKKLSSQHLKPYIVDSLPFPRPAFEDTFVQRVGPIVLRLVCTSPEMTPFWNQMATLGFVERVFDNEVPADALVDLESRAAARAELDAYVAARVFGLTSKELADVLDTFEVLRRRDESAHGEFLTKRRILEMFERVD